MSVNNFNNLKNNKDMICAICQEKFRDKPHNIIKTSCNHFFHVTCLNSWCEGIPRTIETNGIVKIHPKWLRCPLCNEHIWEDCTTAWNKVQSSV